MLVKCEQTGIFFKGQRLEKDDQIEINSIEELGQYQGLFSEIIETGFVEEGKKEKKTKKGGTK